MSSLSFHDKQHVHRLLQQQGQVKSIFDEFVRKSGEILKQWYAKNTDNVWIENAGLEKQIDNLLVELQSNLLRNIDANTRASWEASNIKTDDLIKGFIKDLAVSESVTKGMFTRNMDAYKAFATQNIKGLTVADRVWKVADGAKQNLEYYLSSGISTGRPAASISQDIRQLLQNPDKRFRRVKDEYGKLTLSKPMKEYHPGQGVYRSSYMNALRIAATQTNMSYHEADYQRWQGLDFVLGIEVSRSKSNKGACPICDPMVGRYPKDFKFLSWHPWCICQAVPVMLEGEEFTDFLISGKIPQNKIIKDMPQSAKDFIKNNPKTVEKSLWGKQFSSVEGIDNKKAIQKIVDNKPYTLNADNLKERGYNLNGDIVKEYDKVIKGFNLEQFDDDFTHISQKYGIEIQGKYISSYKENAVLTIEGTNGFIMKRSFENSKVYHDLLILPEDIQGKGFSKELFKSLYKQYENAGMKSIEIQANKDVGGYTWARYGFSASYSKAKNVAFEAFEKGRITQQEYHEIYKMIDDYDLNNPKENRFPMNLLTGKPYSRDMLLESNWKGELDLTNKEQKTRFEDYLFNR